MTQIQTENQNKQDQLNRSKKKIPEDLNSIYTTLTKLTESYSKGTNPSHDEEKSITISTPLSLIALTCHTFLISNSFRLNASSALQHESHSNQDSSLLTDWSALLAPDRHSLQFSYSHSQSNLCFEFTFSKIGNRVCISGITVEDDRLSTWNLLISEYVETSTFPIELTREQQMDSIGFRSSTHLLNFISLFVNEILNPLLPDLFPITSINQRSPPQASTNNASRQSFTHHQVPSPGATFTEPLNRPSQVSNPMRAPLEIGRSDLEPIGTSNLQIPSLYNHLPSSNLDERSGMMLGPNHPIFHPPHRMAWPETFHPPGARFDPIGPNPSSSAFFPRPNPGLDMDPMGGLGQGLPLQNPRLGFQPNRSDFNEFRPPGGAGRSGYDDMFM